MSQVLDGLHRDHINLGRLLGLLEQQVRLIGAEEGAPDYSLLLDIVEYIESYSDQIHHPKEDVMFQLYLDRHQPQRQEIEVLIEEHRQMREDTHGFYEALTGVTQGKILPVARLRAQGEAFLRQQRDHLNREEATVFPLLRREFTPAEWEEVDRTAPSGPDPLFGDQVEQQHQALLQRIEESGE